MENRTKIGGRPQKKPIEKLSQAVTVKYTKLDYMALKRRANTANVSLAEYIRKASFSCEIKTRLTVEQMDVIRKLIGEANNINQLARIANRFGCEVILPDLKFCLEKIKAIIKIFE